MGAKSSVIPSLLLLASCLFIAKLPCCTPLSFSYDFSNPSTFNHLDIAMDGSASLDTLIELTQSADPQYKDRFDKVGRAFYSHPVPLWDETTGEVTSFTTNFSFVIKSSSTNNSFGPSDGLAFFLSSSSPSTMPHFQDGGNLGLFNNTKAMNLSAATGMVAVEFDTFKNDWDPTSDHIGIDVDSINSTVVQPLPDLRLTTGSKPMVARVSYNNSTRMLAVVLQMDPKDGGMKYELNSTVDLKSLLLPQVTIGFAAASGWSVYLHRVLSWSFTSTLVVRQVTKEPTVNPPRDDSKDRRPVAGVVVGVLITSVAVVGGLTWFVVAAMRRRRMREEYNMGGSDEDGMDDEFEQGSGPRRFLYGQLATATNNFSEDGKLGEGGFGSVYRGSLSEPGGLQLQVAVKRISKTSKQGRKEYASEVKIISRLRHRNLVQLVGWCHGRGDFLLVYELVPNEIGIRLLEWVWDLHGRGTILEAADERLRGEFDTKQMECVMVVGLWCAHPDHGVRPSIKQALDALQFEAPLPRLPPKMPVPTYSQPPCPTPYFNPAAGDLSSSTGNSSATTGSSSCSASAESSSLLKEQQQQQWY
ncbi:hypothetical protein ABZP36_000590 [Zizania latifolia]